MYHLVQQQNKVKTLFEESVEGIFYSVYEELGDNLTDEFLRDYPFIFIGQIIEKVYHELYFEQFMESVNQAVIRGDHEIFGMSREDFTFHAYEGRIEFDDSFAPQFDVNDVGTVVQKILTEQNIAYLDYDLKMKNQVIKEVW